MFAEMAPGADLDDPEVRRQLRNSATIPTHALDELRRIGDSGGASPRHHRPDDDCARLARHDDLARVLANARRAHGRRSARVSRRSPHRRSREILLDRCGTPSSGLRPERGLSRASGRTERSLRSWRVPRFPQLRQLVLAALAQRGQPIIAVGTQHLNERLRNRQVAVPLAVGGDDIPGRPASSRWRRSPPRRRPCTRPSVRRSCQSPSESFHHFSISSCRARRRSSCVSLLMWRKNLATIVRDWARSSSKSLMCG